MMLCVLVCDVLGTPMYMFVYTMNIYMYVYCDGIFVMYVVTNVCLITVSNIVLLFHTCKLTIYRYT